MTMLLTLLLLVCSIGVTDELPQVQSLANYDYDILEENLIDVGPMKKEHVDGKTVLTYVDSQRSKKRQKLDENLGKGTGNPQNERGTGKFSQQQVR